LQEYPNGHGKSTLYEGGVRVPMIVAGAGVDRRGEREDALVNASDIYATILEAIGNDLPGGIHNSLSFEPLLSGEMPMQRDYIYAELGDDWTIRNRQYKLIQYTDGSQEFFDLEADSIEFNELLISGDLNAQQLAAKADLELEASAIRTGWSCRDLIQNGEETGIDCGGACVPCIITSTQDTEVPIEVVLFPNPVHEVLNIQAEQFAIESVRVFGPTGQLIEASLEMNTFGTEIDLSGLPSQLYLVEVSVSDGGSQTFRVLKQ
ncbi:MAG: sulfatase/phosphatase domain-containing protein, partial [Bacteroidota bacterium]